MNIKVLKLSYLFHWVDTLLLKWQLRNVTFDQLVKQFKDKGYKPVMSGSKRIFTLPNKAKVILTPTNDGYDVEITTPKIVANQK